MNTFKLSKPERLAIIRFCLNNGTRIKCSTHSLVRPLEMRYLDDAFKEWDGENAARFEKARKEIEDYKNGGPLSWFFIVHGVRKKPTIQELEECLNRAIEEEEISNIRKSYSIAVDFVYLSEEILNFHNSMNPKITFGYSNVLHEECDSEITDAVRRRLLPCFKENKNIDLDFTFGGFKVGDFTADESPLYYEDLIISRGDKEILSTTTHEYEFDLFFNDEDIAAFRSFEGKTERNEKIINKLLKPVKYD